MTALSAPPRPQSVVVVGGGVFGCAIAYQLAKRAIKTTLIERDAFGTHASGNNPGNLNPVHASPAALVGFALQSFALHQRLAGELAELGCTGYALQPVRRILLAFDDADRRALAHAAGMFQTSGHAMQQFSTEWLERDELLRREARLSAAVCGGLLLDGNMSVDSAAYTNALAEGAARRGARLLRSDVVGLIRRHGRVVGVRTAHGNVACDALVLATGPWGEPTRQWTGFDARIAPVKGEMLRLQIDGAPLEYDFTRGMTSLYRRGADQCWVGVTKQAAGFDVSPTLQAREHLLETAAQMMPALRQATVLAHVAALRPMGAHGLPVIGPLPGCENVWLANGGGIKGVLLSAGVGLAIAQMVCGDTVEVDLAGCIVPGHAPASVDSQHQGA